MFAIDVTALPGGGGKACVRCDLASIVEVSEQALRIEYRSEFRPYSFGASKSGRFFRRFQRWLPDFGMPRFDIDGRACWFYLRFIAENTRHPLKELDFSLHDLVGMHVELLG